LKEYQFAEVDQVLAGPNWENVAEPKF